MSLSRSAALFALSTAALLARDARAQTQCHVEVVPMQLTDFTRIASLPRFDPALGQLVGVDIEVSAHVLGAARLESLDAQPSIVNTVFAADVELRQDDMSLVMLMIPIADFSDALLAYDGVLDYGGTSGITHANIQAQDQRALTIEPTPAHLALFTGAGTIDFVANANASSSAAGAGNLVAQFDTSARVDVRVCYQYVGNNPPTVSCPGPLMASVGVPMSFQVCANDPDAGDVVTLNGVLPAGAVANPPFPVVGNPACTTITWTPASDQVGNISFTFTANDVADTSATCTTVVGSAECHMVFGVGGGGSSSITLFGHLYDTQLARVRLSYPVTMVDHPSFPARAMPPTATVQVLMYNPLVFPSNASQWSRAMTYVRDPVTHTFATSYSGTRNGIDVRLETFVQGGHVRARFPFTIDGM